MVKIKIPSTGQVYSLDEKLNCGCEILVESEGIIEPAIVLCEKNIVVKNAEIKPAKLIRVFAEDDIILKRKIKEKAAGYLDEARAKVFRHGLEMKILDADLSFDEKKLTFYFSAEGRVDFRALVSDMVGDFNKIIRLQQVGSREEAKHFGGFGKCGRPLCCATFLNNLDNANVEMAENLENVNTKSPKIAGCCGKMMCCMAYEDEKEKKAEVAK